MNRYANLCWGQRYVWLKHYQLPPGERDELNFVIGIKPARGSTVDSIRRALDLLVRRHEGLRSTCHPGDGNGPVQRVHPPGPAPVVCYESADYPSDVLTKLVNEVGSAEFVLDREWPFRGCIVTTQSVPTRVVLVGHHTAMDDWSLRLLRQEVDELHDSIMARRTAALRPVSHHPVDLARYEQSAEVTGFHRRSLDHWDRGLARIEADQYAARRIGRAGDSQGGAAGLSASLSSPAALSGLRDLAARHGVWSSIVSTAAFTALLAAYTHRPVVHYRTYASNRDVHRYQDVVTCMFQPVLVHLDCADDPPFAELVRRTAEQCGAALRNSYCAYDEIMEMISRRSSERGVGLRIGSVFNHLRHPERARGGERAVFNWNPPPGSWTLLDDDCYLRVSEWRDCVVATLNASAAVMTPGDAERFLRGFEALLVAEGGVSDQLRVSEIGRRAGFSALAGESPDGTGATAGIGDGAADDTRRIADCLRDYPGVRAAGVFVRSMPAGGRRLTAYVAAADPAIQPGALRVHLLGRLYEGGICCPAQFVVCGQAPADPGSVSSWEELRVRAAGSGHQVPERGPVTEQERCLHETVRAVNGLDHVNMADSYVLAGGRIRNITTIQQTMRGHGWAGPTLYEIASARPLAAIAAMYRADAEPERNHTDLADEDG